MDSATCAQVGDPELWYPKSRRGYLIDWSIPRKVCIGCPVKDPCLVAALKEEANEQYIFGMRGAKNPKERRELLTQIYGKARTSWVKRSRSVQMERLEEAVTALYADGDRSRAQAWSQIVELRRMQSPQD